MAIYKNCDYSYPVQSENIRLRCFLEEVPNPIDSI